MPRHQRLAVEDSIHRLYFASPDIIGAQKICEQALKILSKSGWGHNLTNIFAGIEHDTQVSIDSYYKQAASLFGWPLDLVTFLDEASNYEDLNYHIIEDRERPYVQIEQFEALALISIILTGAVPPNSEFKLYQTLRSVPEQILRARHGLPVFGEDGSTLGAFSKLKGVDLLNFIAEAISVFELEQSVEGLDLRLTDASELELWLHRMHRTTDQIPEFKLPRKGAYGWHDKYIANLTQAFLSRASGWGDRGSFWTRGTRYQGKSVVFNEHKQVFEEVHWDFDHSFVTQVPRNSYDLNQEFRVEYVHKLCRRLGYQIHRCWTKGYSINGSYPELWRDVARVYRHETPLVCIWESCTGHHPKFRVQLLSALSEEFAHAFEVWM